MVTHDRRSPPLEKHRMRAVGAIVLVGAVAVATVAASTSQGVQRVPPSPQASSLRCEPSLEFPAAAGARALGADRSPVSAAGLQVAGGPHVAYWQIVQQYRHRDAASAMEGLRRLGEPAVRIAVRAVQKEVAGGTTSLWSLSDVRAAALFHLELVLREPPEAPWELSTHLDLSRQLVSLVDALDRGAEAVVFSRRWRLALVWRAEGALVLDVAAEELEQLRRRWPADAEYFLSDGSLHETSASPRFADSLRLPRAKMPNRSTLRTHLRHAESSYRAALRLDPSLDEARLRLGRVLFTLQRDVEAREVLRPLFEGAVRSNAYLARLFAGACEERSGKLQAAVEDYRAAQLFAPLAPTPYIALSRALRRAGDRPQALEMAAGVQGATGDDPWWDYQLGQARRLPGLLDAMRRGVLQ
jgi:tetratricopeptide (TPR) repeat protein